MPAIHEMVQEPYDVLFVVSFFSFGFRKLRDFAVRYNSSKECRDKAPSKLGF